LGVGGAELAAQEITRQMFPGKDAKDLTEREKQQVSALSQLAVGLAGGITTGDTAGAITAAQTGKNAVENNALSGFGAGFLNNVQAQGSLVNNTNLTDETGKVLNPATPEEIKYASDKLVTGDLPEGANITKVIVEGYKDGVLIAGAAYLGPAATVGKVVGGATIAEIANGSYQWFDLSQPGNENKGWDYWSSGSAAIMGALAPGREIGANIGIAAGGAIFTDGTNAGAISGAVIGSAAGGYFGKYAPDIVDKYIGKELPGFIYDMGGAFVSESINEVSKEASKKIGGNE